MYAGIDIGGTKTLVASIDDNGVITQKIRFETPKNYEFFLHELRFAVHKLDNKEFDAGGVGAPGRIDRVHGRGINFGNLGWKDVPILDDAERIFHCPMALENDAKLAALSEALLLMNKYSKILYVTISTGIGWAVIENCRIDDAIGDGGGKAMLVEHHRKLVPWESFASGHAIVERYGKKAEEIHDAKTWRAIVRDLKPGLIELIAIAEPEAIVFGGSVGVYFDRYGKYLREELKKTHIPLVTMPDLRAAQRPEEAVLFGAYDLAIQRFGRAIGKEHHAHAR
jgi:predicted NBD/HSP70 family sugar kinase